MILNMVLKGTRSLNNIVKSVFLTCMTIGISTCLGGCSTTRTYEFNPFRDIPRNETERLYAQGYKTKGNDAARIQVFEQALASAQKDKNPYVERNAAAELVTLYLKAKDYAKAEKYCLLLADIRDKTLARMTPLPQEEKTKDPFPVYPKEIAFVYEKLNKPDEAEKALLRYKESDEKAGFGDSLSHHEVMEELSRHYMRTEQWRKASPILYSLIEHNNDRWVHDYVVCQQKLNEPGPAIQMLRQMIEKIGVPRDPAPEPQAPDTNPINRTLDDVKTKMEDLARYSLVPLYKDLGDCLTQAGDEAGASEAYAKSTKYKLQLH